MVSEIDIEKFLSSGCGYGYGDGYRYGSCNGNGYGYGDGCCGNGNGNGDGYGNGGCGCGNGNGNGISELDGYKLYKVDGVPTAFESILANYAKGYTVQNNAILIPCFIAKVNGCFAHGKTLHDAEKAAREKYKSTN